jgi:hypothetical protein
VAWAENLPPGGSIHGAQAAEGQESQAAGKIQSTSGAGLIDWADE